MNIIVASDENYVPHLETLIISIGETNFKKEKILIHIFDGGISYESTQIIKELSKKYKNLLFKFYEMSEEKISSLIGGEISRDRSLSTYARIFIPSIIKDERALYLDVDAIVLEDLQEFYSCDMENYAIAGVRDTNPISRHRNVGLKDNDIYINAGMILWNLKKCRELNIVEQFIKFIHMRKGKIDAMDQGTINGVLGSQNLIKVVSPKYNVITSLFQLKNKDILKIYNLPNYYSDEEIKEAIEKPVYVHYTPNMTTRPWVENCKHPLKNKYWYFREKGNFNLKILEKDKRNIKNRFLGFVYRNFTLIFYKYALLKRRGIKDE